MLTILLADQRLRTNAVQDICLRIEFKHYKLHFYFALNSNVKATLKKNDQGFYKL